MLRLEYLVVLLLVCGRQVGSSVVGGGDDGGGEGHLRGRYSRQLSSTEDALTGDIVKTFNGKVPRVRCEAGFYRPSGGSNLQMITGQKLDGCIPCPRGVYGSTTGLTDRSCTGSCPLGKYSSMVGRTSADDCLPCPLGRYGSGIALTSSLCSGACPTGKYSQLEGATSVSACTPCDLGEQGCTLPVLSRFDRRTGNLNS